MKLLSFFIFFIFIFFYGCSTVAHTGRQQLNLVPNSQLVSMSSLEYSKTLGSSKLSKNQRQVAMIKRAGVRIQHAVERYMASKERSDQLAGYKWEFNLVEDSKVVNAWCMPGGKVAFYTGILPICQNELGVAVVMGHEVAHAIANHGRERMSQSMIAQLGMSVLTGVLDPSKTSPYLLQAVGIGTNLGMLKFSRDHESEADHLGLVFMAMAGYDPHEASIFWQRMSVASGGQFPMEFFSTHPSHETRVADLNKWLPEALSYYNKN